LDIKFVPHKIEGTQYYQISAIDHHSSWRLIRTYQDRTLSSVLEFLDELEKNCPFPIEQIQTDNATEFTDKFSSQRGLRPTEFHLFDEWCKAQGIRQKLIPVGEKEINGKVENSHKWDDEEFYSQHRFNCFAELREKTQEYNEYWNIARHVKSLNWKTPEEMVELAYVRALVFAKMIREKYPTPEYEKIFNPAGAIVKLL
jgi:hypothetical protein